MTDHIGPEPEPEPEPHTDVEAMHRQVARRVGPRSRELPEPTEGSEPPPWWLWAVVVVSIFVAGYYMGRHLGSFTLTPHGGFGAPESVRSRPELASAESGADLFQSRCASCHQPDGRGLAPAYPPLVGSIWVTGNPEIPIRILLLGLTGELEVAGQLYNGVMPSWSMMTDEQIAKVVSHVRQLSGASPVDAELVAKVRQAVAGEPSPMPAERLRSLLKGSS